MCKYKPVLILGSLQTHAAKMLVEGGYAPVSDVRISGSRESLRCIRIFKVWKSQQNGWVYDPQGISPCLNAGHHAGVEPKIIVYEEQE